jgi:homoserine O-acetyltransferase
MLIDMIRSDPGYCDGHYTSRPAAVATAWELFNLMADSPSHLKDAFEGPDSADQFKKDLKASARQTEDANDVVWEFDASRDYNPSPEKVGAPLLAVNFASDSCMALYYPCFRDTRFCWAVWRCHSLGRDLSTVFSEQLIRC